MPSTIEHLSAAIFDLDQALAIAPQFVQAYAYRGSARHHNCEPLVFVYYLRAFQLNESLAAREIIELVRLDLRRNPENAFQVCNKHLARLPDDPVALLRRGLSLLLLNRTEEAMGDLGRAAGLSPEIRSGRERLERAVNELQDHLKNEATVPNEGLPLPKKHRFRMGPRS